MKTSRNLSQISPSEILEICWWKFGDLDLKTCCNAVTAKLKLAASFKTGVYCI